jgi:hypothetical protein
MGSLWENIDKVVVERLEQRQQARRVGGRQ